MKSIPALAATTLALLLPATAGAATVGTTAVYAPITNNAAGAAQVYRFTASSSGQVDRLNVYLDGSNTAGKVELGLYTGTASSADRRRARCQIASPGANAWNSCSIATSSVTAGAYYWLALLQPVAVVGRMQYREGTVSGGPVTYLSKSKKLTELPSSWARGASWTGGYQASVYADQAATVTPSPSPTPTPTPSPSSSPSPTPTPTPSPTPTPTPSPSPAPSGFPDVASTGVPAGTTLGAYTGPSTISTPGTVIDAKAIGCLRVTVPGVIIRNSKITCSGGYAVLSADGDYAGTPLLIEDSEIDCQASTGTGIGEANITLRRVEIRGCQNGGDLNQNITIEDSLIHKLSNAGSDPHEDGLQFAWGHVENGQIVPASRNLTIRHNTIYGINADGSFGTSAIISNKGGDENVLIENNLLAGGAVAIYCEQGAKGTNYRVLNNAFSRTFSQKVGFYGISTDCSDETQSGNHYLETGHAVTLP